MVVIDGAYGFGNEFVMPAGPLRELVSDGLARADVVVILGDDQAGVRENRVRRVRHARNEAVARSLDRRVSQHELLHVNVGPQWDLMNLQYEYVYVILLITEIDSAGLGMTKRPGS